MSQADNYATKVQLHTAAMQARNAALLLCRTEIQQDQALTIVILDAVLVLGFFILVIVYHFAIIELLVDGPVDTNPPSHSRKPLRRSGTCAIVTW